MAYKQSILQAIPPQHSFEPLMTCYLTDATTPANVAEARGAGVVAFKLYPAGATTNSDSGVTNLSALKGTLQAMAEVGLVAQRLLETGSHATRGAEIGWGAKK